MTQRTQRTQLVPFLVASLVGCAALFVGCAAPSPRPAAPSVPKAAAPEIRQGKWKIRDTRLFVRDVGPKQAPALVVVHGGPGGNHRSLRPLEALSPTYRVVLYDQRGAGESDRLPIDTAQPDLAKLSLRQNVEDLEALRVKLAKDKITLIGHSWGAALAVFYAAAYPDRVDKLVVYSGGPETRALSRRKRAAHNARLTPAEGAKLGQGMKAVVAAVKAGASQAKLDRRFAKLAAVLFPALYCKRHGKRPAATTKGHDIGRGGFWANQGAGQYVETFRYEDIAAGLKRLKAPTLLTWGRCEPSPRARLTNLLDHIDNARFVVFERSGHNAIEEEPQLFFATLRAFLGGKTLPVKSHASRQAYSATVLAERGAALQRWGERLTRWFYAGELTRLSALFSPQMKQALPPAKVKAFRDGLLEHLGPEKSVVRTSQTLLPSAAIYRRVVRFTKAPQPQQLVWTLTNLDSAEPVIAGLLLRPPGKPAETARLAYQTKAELTLPVKGQWSVVWGGRTLAQNYHAATGDQRFAYDLLVAKDGETHSGDGKRNEQYYCFGRPILAAGAGRVVAASDGQDDRQPGVMVKKDPLGNHVIIDHGHKEFGFYCHLQRGSVTVKVGQKISAAAPIGRCGNSGHSSEAHLHFHLQDTPRPLKGKGIPAQFQRYRANGKRVARGEPTQGQVVEPAE